MDLGSPRFQLVEGVVSSWGPVPGAMGIITGDQMFTDDFEIQEIDNIVYEVDCSMKEPDLHEGDPQLWSLILSTTSFFSILYWT